MRVPVCFRTLASLSLLGLRLVLRDSLMRSVIAGHIRSEDVAATASLTATQTRSEHASPNEVFPTFFFIRHIRVRLEKSLRRE